MRKFLFLIVLCAAFGYHSNAQEHVITGVVSGLDGSPIPSATVQSNIGNSAVQTDENGRFKISTPPNAILTISSIGFETKTIDVKNQSSLYVTLSPKAKGLNDVVVTALGLLKKENSIGYSTTQ